MRHAVLIGLMAASVLGICAAAGPNRVLFAQQPLFKGSVDIVTVNVTATDPSHRYVSNLTKDDFLIFEDGRKQAITVFQQTGVPIRLAMLLDTSASMEQTLPIAQQAAIGFVRELGPGDGATIIDFDTRVRVRQTFTENIGALEAAIRQTRLGGSTALHNALYIALKELNKVSDQEQAAGPRRRAIIVLSDGDDTSSVVTFDTVLDLATRSDTAIYAIGLLGNDSGGRDPHDAKFVLRQLAQQTGGRAFPKSANEFENIYREIRAELSNQYLLAYESDNARRDGQYRRIAIRVNKPDIIARTRAGYYAPRN